MDGFPGFLFFLYLGLRRLCLGVRGWGWFKIVGKCFGSNNDIAIRSYRCPIGHFYISANRTADIPVRNAENINAGFIQPIIQVAQQVNIFSRILAIYYSRQDNIARFLIPLQRQISPRADICFNTAILDIYDICIINELLAVKERTSVKVNVSCRQRYATNGIDMTGNRNRSGKIEGHFTILNAFRAEEISTLQQCGVTEQLLVIRVSRHHHAYLSGIDNAC